LSYGNLDAGCSPLTFDAGGCLLAGSIIVGLAIVHELYEKFGPKGPPLPDDIGPIDREAPFFVRLTSPV